MSPPASSDPAAAIGFFGKLPAHGDFVRRVFPVAWHRRWDDWLQAGLAASRETLGADWLDCYLSSPLWRFVLAAPSGTSSAWIGVMMPSVDRVGRYFPLTALAPLPVGIGPFVAVAHTRDWFAALEPILLGALEDDGADADVLAAELARLSLPALSGAASASAVMPDAVAEIGTMRERFTMPLASADELPTAIPAWADALAGHCIGELSLWWTSGSAYVPAGARLYPGLPPTHQFWTLLRGDRPVE